MRRLKNIGVIMIAALIFFGAIIISFNFSKITDVVEVKKNDVLADPGNSWDSPRIYITNGDYGRGGVIPISVAGESSINIDSYDVTGTADVKIYEASKNNLLEFLVHDDKNDQINKKIDFNNLKLVAATKHEIKYGGSKFAFPEKLLGIYILNIKINNIEENVFVIRSNTGVVSTEGDNEIILWAQDFKTKRSASGAKGTIYNLLEKQKILSTVLFDEEGIAKFPASSKADIGIVEKDGDISLIIFNLNYINSGYRYERFSPQTKSTKYFLFMDRPLYRPGDTVHFKSIMRDDYDAEYSASSGSVTVKAYKGWDPDKNVVFSKNYQISASGSVSGDFVLPEDISTGNYYLRVERTGGGENWWWQGSLSTVSFNVEYFKKPEYGIDISVPYDEYIVGDQLTFNIDGKYFYGQPIAQKEVEYTIYSSDYYNYGYYYNDNQNLSDDYRYGYWYGSGKMKEGKAMFDNNGMAIVDFGRTAPNEKSQIYTIEATFKDETGIPVFARKNILVHNGEFGIYRSKWRYSSMVGEKASLELKLLSYKDRNIKNIPLNVKTKRESWIYSGNRYETESENLADSVITTNDNGEAVFNFVPKKSGSYDITISGKDGIGNEISNSFYVWVSDKNGYYYDFSDDKNLSIKAEREKYDPSDKVKFSITSKIPDRDLFLSLERGWTRRFEIVHMKGQTATVEIPLENSDMPNLFAKAVSFNNDYLDESSAEIEVSAESKKINVLLETNLEKYGPGDDVSLNIQTTDMRGNPVSAEVAVWVVDKALFELAESNTGDIFENFWHRRYNNTTSSNSLQQLMVNNAEHGGCFAKGTKVLMSDKSQKNIEDVRIGDMIMTRKNDCNPNLVEAKVVGLHNQEAAGYLIINGQLKITLNHILWVNDKWTDAGSIQIGDYITDQDNQKIEVSSIEWQQGKYDVYNLEIENYHTYFADGFWVHNDKDGGARTIFKDVVYWNPKVMTNYNGRGRVMFKLPDNLTTWVIKGIAITPDTKVGQNFSEIIVGKNIIVRPILPNILRDGDALVLSALVQNYTDKDYNFDASLLFDSGSVANQTQEVFVKAKSMEQIYWPVFPEKENNAAKFTFSAVAKEDKKISDSITTEIPLRLFGFWNAKSAVDNGDNNFILKFTEKANQNKSNIEITVASTIIGSLPDAMKYLVGYPYGCMEQTTSRFVPAVIAKENPDLFSEALSDKDIDDMIRTGIKKLVMHQNNDGGWSWWHSENSDPFISAYVSEYLLKAKEAKVEFSDEIIIRAKEYFEKLNITDRNNENYVYRNYALALFDSEIGREQITNFDNLMFDTLATAVMANIKNGNKDSKTNGMEKLIKLGKEHGDGIYWGSGKDDYFGSTDTSTALVLRAIIAGGENREIAAKAARYLVNNKKSNRWANTYATARVIQALVDFSRTGNEFNPNYSYTIKLDNKIIHQGEMNKFNQSDSISISADDINKAGSLLEIIKKGNGQLYSSAVINEFYTDRNMAEESNGLEIEREYVNTKGENYSIGAGDIIEVRLNVKNLGDKNSYVVIEDSLPAGLAPINTNLINEEYGNSGNRYGWSYWGSDSEITENGIIYYTRYLDSKNQTFSYKARAISEGVFSAPPAKAALMYYPEINGHSKAEKITIGSESEKLYDLKPEPSAEKIMKTAEKNEKSDNIYSVILVIVILIFSALAVVGMLAIKNKKNDGGNKK